VWCGSKVRMLPVLLVGVVYNKVLTCVEGEHLA
jgi:hypothetical protein